MARQSSWKISMEALPGEVYRVYSAFLLHFFEKFPAERYTIAQSTVACGKYSVFRKDHLKRVKPDTWLEQDVLSKNECVYLLDDRFELSVPVVLLSPQELNRLFGQYLGWTKFYETYPDSPGMLYFSRPGFSQDESQAIFYMGFQRYGRAGEGYLAVMEQKDRQWQVKKQEMLWHA